MRDFLVGEVMTGIGGEGGVRCGLIGEVGCSHPLTHHEIRSLQAAAAAQKITGEGWRVLGLLSSFIILEFLRFLRSY